MRKDWWWMSLLPVVSFGLVLFVGAAAWNFRVLQVVPNFGGVSLTSAAGVRSSLGALVAGQHAIVIAVFLLVVAAGLLVLTAGWTTWSIRREAYDGGKRVAMGWTDIFLSAVAVIGSLAAPAIPLLFLKEAQCGRPRLYQCMGDLLITMPDKAQSILPELIDFYLAKLVINDIKPADTLLEAVNWGNGAVIIASLFLLMTMVMLPRGLERTDNSTTSVTIADLKAWFGHRVRRFEMLSFLTSLVMVAGIGLMSTWMKWPVVLMNEHVLTDKSAADALKNGYESLANSVLQFSAVWYGLLVAALLFTTRWVLSKKCRCLAKEIVDAGVDPAKTEAQKLIDETFAGTSLQVYFERYRTYLLALAPAIAQQLLAVFGK